MKTPVNSYDAVRQGIPPITEALHDLMRRIEAEYREMPGMAITEAQAKRLWGLDATTCSFALMTLVQRGILRRTARGTFIRC